MNYTMTATEQHSPAPAEVASVGTAQAFRIKRMGARPLRFNGTELAMAMSYTPDLPYWYEINIYRTDDQRFALAVRLFFQSEEEKDTVRAWTFDSLPDLFDALEAYDAGEDVRAPVLEPSAAPVELAATALDLRARISAARQHFSGLVGELFAEIDDPALT